MYRTIYLNMKDGLEDWENYGKVLQELYLYNETLPQDKKFFLEDGVSFDTEWYNKDVLSYCSFEDRVIFEFDTDTDVIAICDDFNSFYINYRPKTIDTRLIKETCQDIATSLGL